MKRSKLFSFVLVFVLVVAVAAAGCIGGEKTTTQTTTQTQEEKTYKVVIALHTAPGGLDSDAAFKIEQLLEERSNGRLQVEVYTGGALGGEEDMVELMKTGQISVGLFGDYPLANFAPEYAPTQVPFLFTSWELVFEYYDAFWDKINQKLEEKSGMVLLAVQKRGARCLTANKPIEHPEDLKGLKLRLPQLPLWVRVWSSMGAIATPVPWPEVYMALQTGVVDAQENPAETIKIGKLYEVQKYFMTTEHLLSVYHWTASTKFLNELPPDLRKLVVDTVREVVYNWANVEADKRDQEAREFLKSQGMVFIEVNKEEFAAAARPEIQKIAEEAWAPEVREWLKEKGLL